MGQELVCIILKCNASVVLSQMFNDGLDLRDADMGALHNLSNHGW